MELTLLDYLVFFAFVAGVVFFGCSFYRRSKAGASAFTKAEGNVPAWVVGMSIFATFVSSISFLGLPGGSFSGNWNQLVFSFSIPIATWLAAKIFIPLYRNIGSVSAYQFLEDRYGYWARCYVAVCYLLTQVCRVGSILLLLAIPLNTMFGWDISSIIIATGILTLVFSVAGGISAVVWTDAVQGIVLIVGALACALILTLGMPEGPGQLFTIAAADHKFSLGSLGLTLREPTVWVVLVYGIFMNLQNYGIDQNYVQRYMTARSTKEAVRGTLFGGLLYIPVSLVFVYIGTALYSYYSAQPGILPEGISGDKVFPYFIVHGLPTGLTGLVIASLFSAGMSTVSTSINSSATIVFTDFFSKLRGKEKASRREQMGVLYVSSAVVGLAGILVGLAMQKIDGVLDAWWKLSSIFSGGMLGLFLLALACRKPGRTASIIAVAVGLAVIAWMSLPVFKCPIHTYMTIVFGTTAIFLVGFVLTKALNRKGICLTAVVAALILMPSCSREKKVTPVFMGDPAIEARVEKTLKGMTLEEKAGQMVQLTISVLEDDTREALDPAKLDRIFGEYKIGSILNVMNGRAHTREQTARMIRQIQEKSMDAIGIPCIYGLDMVHGANYLTDATFFPHEINIAATFDRSFARRMGEVTAYETRAAMVPWVFTPTVDLGRDPRWPRIWENLGEDPYLATEMSVAETVGLQGKDPNHPGPDKVAANLKCFIAYSVPYTGKDRTPAYVPEKDLREKFFAPFLGGFRAGALSIMVNSSSVNGIPMHSNKDLLTGWAKDQTGWDGMIVTDWADIDNLYVRDHVAEDKREAVKIGINAGIDMIMEPYDPECCNIIADLARSGEIPMSRIDDAVRRVLRLKYRIGLFDNPVWDTEAFIKFGCEEFAGDSYRAAVESEVLLKNEGVLPISKGARILVAGPNANSLRTLNGGWSYTWQGEGDSYVPQYNTILEAVRNNFGEKNVVYEPGVTYDLSVNDWQREKEPQIGNAVAAARGVDVILVCVGENTYCETPGNIDDLNLSKNQKDLVRALAATGKPVVLILNEGRPRIIGDIEPLAKAVVDIMLPSNYGGDALAALLAGEENFSGKLPFTYPKHTSTLQTYDNDAGTDIQWPFGHGLSYTEYEYSDFIFEGPEAFTAEDMLRFTVVVKNIGDREGKEAVLLYSSDIVASTIPDVKRLRAFTKVGLEVGESRTVTFEVPASSLAFVGQDGRWRLEEGDFRISCGGLSTTIHCGETRIWDDPNQNR